jgi:mRNA interferase HicA
MKLEALERHMRQCGCIFYRQGGSHAIWRNQAARTIPSVPRHREIKEGTVRAICRQLEIPQP